MFTDATISHRVFTFALGKSSKAEQPTPVTQEEHVHREHHPQSGSQHSHCYVLFSTFSSYCITGVNLLLINALENKMIGMHACNLMRCVNGCGHSFIIICSVLGDFPLESTICYHYVITSWYFFHDE